MKPLFTLFISAALMVTTASCNREKGCMDPNSVNYNSAAQVDDGSCRYAPKVDVITPTIESCKAPFQVRFTAEGANLTGIESYSWNFGNGQTSTLTQPTTIFSTSGTYTINLTVSNGNGSTSSSYTLTLANSYTPSVFFDFYMERNNFRAPAQANFRNYSQFVNSFKWEFGDNSASIETSPTKIYTTPGSYTVKLEGTCDGATYSYTRNVEILGPPFAMELTQFNLNLNNQTYAGQDFYIEILYDGVSRGLAQIVYIPTFPYSFYLPLDLAWGTATITNLGYAPAREIRINVWQDNTNQVVKNYTFTTGWWQTNFYPKQVTWSDNTSLVLNYY